MKTNTIVKNILVIAALSSFCMPAHGMLSVFNSVKKLMDRVTLNNTIDAISGVKNSLQRYPILSLSVCVPFIAYGACKAYDECESVVNYDGALAEAIEDKNWSKVIVLLERRFGKTASTARWGWDTYIFEHGESVLLEWAFTRWGSDALEYLLKCGAPLDKNRPDGNTTLYAVTQGYDEKVMEVILRYCAENNITLRDREKTFFDCSSYYLSRLPNRILLLQDGLCFQESDLQKLENIKFEADHRGWSFNEDRKPEYAKLSHLLAYAIQDVHTRKVCENKFHNQKIYLLKHKQLIDTYWRFK